MEQEKYLNKFIKIYPILKGFTDDLLFFIAIDTLFFTVAKGLSAQQIVFLTSISSIFSVICRATFIRIIKKIGNTKSVRLGMGLLLLSSLFITFGTSYAWILIGKIIYEIAFVFKDMEDVMLKNNLKILGKADDYAKITNKKMNVYAFLTLIVALSSGALFNINPYMPMLLCITVCMVSFIIQLYYMKDISKNDIINEKHKKKRMKINKTMWIIFISYAVFYGLIVCGQENEKLLIQYQLTNAYDIAKVSIYLSIIVSLSRLSRFLGSVFFGKVYYEIKDRSLLILTTILFSSFLFIVIGYFIKVMLLKFILMAIGFCIILAVREPFALYTSDTILKLTEPQEAQEAISYMQFSRRLGTTICTFLASAILLKWDIIYVIVVLGVLAIIEIFIAMRLYSIINLRDTKDEANYSNSNN